MALEGSKTKFTSQSIDNWNFDEDYSISRRANYVYNPISDQFEPETKIPGNGTLAIDGLSSPGDNLTFQKVVGGVTYTKTFTYSGSGPYTLSISQWS